jgi:excisionase family DNA binding protein
MTPIPSAHAGNPPAVAPLAYSIPDAARLLGIGKSKAWALVREGVLRPVRLGKRTVIPASEIARVLTPQT